MESKLSRYAYAFIIVGLIVFALIYFKSLIQPFLLAVVVWYLIRSIRLVIGRIKIKGVGVNRRMQGLLAIVVTFGAIWLIYQIISLNIELIIRALPQYEQNWDKLLLGLRELTGIENVEHLIERLRELDLRTFVTGLVNSISLIVGNAALIIVYVIFILIEENFMPIKIQNMITQAHNSQRMSEIIDRITTSINSYFKVKTLVSLLTGVLTYIALLLLDVDFAILWAFLIFIFNYIPYVGSLVATLLPSLFAAFQFGDYLPFFWVFLIVVGIQLFVGNYVEPKILGKSLNLSPLIVVIGLTFWGAIWGVVGMILSVPIISVIVIVMAHFPATRNVAILFSERGSIDSYD